MKSNIIIKWIPMLFIAVSLFFPEDKIFAESVIVICNNSVSEDSLTKEDIKNIFLGMKTTWSNNQKIVFVTLKEGDVHDIFLKEYIGKTIFQYANYWKKQVFTGKGKPPKSFETEEELVNYVADTEGAVGYISPGVENSRVKIISVH